MHHGILIKVRGNTRLAAQHQVEQIIEETMYCPTCSSSVRDVNWDGYSVQGVVDEAWIKFNRSDLGIKTASDLIQWYIELREITLAKLKARFLEELKKYNQDLAKNGDVPRSCMLSYYMTEYNNLREVLDYGDADHGFYTLHCTDNHYSDQTENSDGENLYCFWIDRHY